jgi:2-desacetyl-2-hydroxyethyl bacteriochlorophyllide A dehydrogenase
MDRNNMHALCYSRPGNLKLIERPIPDLQIEEVLIEVAYSGVCGTDLHILKEESPAAEEVILGHEFSGRIIATGNSVHTFKPGDLVAVDPNNYCGTCEYCRRGQVHFCQNIKPIGVFRNGGWAEFCAIPSALVHPVPASIDPAWAALTEPISCILHGWDRIQPLQPEQKILILGAGLIGLLWILILNQLEFSNVILSEPQAHRRETARKLNLPCFEPEQVLKQNSNGPKGFDVIIDCSGNPAAIEHSLDMLNPLGKFLFFGVCPQTSTINIKPFLIFQKEWTFYGSVINPLTFCRALEIIPAIQKPLADLGVITFSLSDYQEGLAAARSGRYTKVLFKINKNL